jgi:TM2 domain-containing membrane protein YozV
VLPAKPPPQEFRGADFYHGLLGGIGAHRFYLRQWGWGIAYILFSWTLIPIVVSLVECFFIRKRTEKYNEQAVNTIVQKMNVIFGYSDEGGQ